MTDDRDRDVISRPDFELLRKLFLDPPPYQPNFEIVSPRVFRLRSGCPLWSNTPDFNHEHEFDCNGQITPNTP